MGTDDSRDGTTSQNLRVDRSSRRRHARATRHAPRATRHTPHDTYPDRDELYALLARATRRLGRQAQVTIREADGLDTDEGSFHDTVSSRPMVPIELGETSAG